MAIITLPQPVADSIGSMTWGQARFDRADVSAVTGGSIVNAGAPPRWTVRLNSKQAMDLRLAGQWEATMLSLRGGINHLAVYDRQRPVPNGTARGSSVTTTASVAAGATSVGITGASRAAPNLLRSSEAFQEISGWYTTAATVTADAHAAPNGLMVAELLTENTATDAHAISSNSSVPTVAGQVYTVSCFVKAAGRSRGALFFFSSAFGGVNPWVHFDLATGVATAHGGLIAPGIEALANGWFRVWGSAVASVTTATSCFIRLLNSVGPLGEQIYTGDGTSGLYLWGAQAEEGYLTPYAGLPTLLRGDWIQIGTGVGSHLAKVTADVTLSSIGAGTVAFEPPTRQAYGSGSAVRIEQALGHFRASGTDTLSWQALPNGPSVQGFAWEGVEAWA